MTDTRHDRGPTPRTSGWVVFAGVTISIAAFANLIYGITVLANSDWVVLTPEALIRFDLTVVGVIMLVFAALQFFVAMGVFQGALWARIFAILAATLNVLAQMAFMSVYASWSWFVIIVNGLVIYGLTVHGDEIAEL